MTYVHSPRSQCEGKKRYPSKGVAKTALKRIRSTVGGAPFDTKGLCIYRCPHCRGFHMGHDRTGLGWRSAD